MAQRFEVEIHCATADQAVTSCDVFVQVIVLEFRTAALSKHFPCGEPYVTLDATATEGAQAASVILDEQHRTGFLWGRTFGPDDGSQHARVAFTQSFDCSLDDFSHCATFPAICGMFINA